MHAIAITLLLLAGPTPEVIAEQRPGWSRNGEPSARELLGAAKLELRLLDLDRALRASERAIAADDAAKSKDSLVLARALELAAALRELRGDPEASKWKARLSATPASPPAVPAPPSGTVEPGPAFVAASMLFLRTKPDVHAAARAQLSAGAAVEVREVTGGWARVHWAGRAARATVWEAWPFEPGRAPRLTEARSARASKAGADGWVAAVHLSTERPDAARLLEAARAHLAARRFDDAVPLLERRAVLVPEDRQGLEDWLGAALGSDRLASAARAADALAHASAFGPFAIETMELLAGCRGNRERALRLTPSPADTARPPPDACAVNVDLEPPCEPCAERDIDEEGERFPAANGREGSDEIDARNAAAEEQWKNGPLAQFKAFVARIARDYPGGPLLHVVLKNRLDRDVAAGQKVTLYGRATTFLDYEGPATDGEAHGSSAELELPPVPAQSELELWIHVPRYAGQEWGLAQTHSAAERTGLETPAAPPPRTDDIGEQDAAAADTRRKEAPHRGAGPLLRPCDACIGC